MNGKNVIGMAAILLAAQMAVGISFACIGDECDGCNRLDFYNYVNTSNADVTVYQVGTKDVSFTNNIEVRSGSLDFTQNVKSDQWELTNLAYLEGTRVTFQGVTIGAQECTDCDAGEIKFNQHIEVDGYLDPWAYQKLEQHCDGTVLEQKVEIQPGGWMRVNQSGWGCAYCGQGFLAQDGWLHSPMGGNNIAWQAGKVDGSTGYNEVSAEWWLNFNQIVSFNME